MESSEEIDDFLEKEIEKLDKEFLSNLKNLQKGQSEKEVEKNYKIKLAETKKHYQDLYKTYLEEQKRRTKIETEKKKNPRKKKDRIKRFRVKKVKLKLSFRQKLHFKYDLFKFKSKIRLKNFFRKITPHFLKIIYIRIKLKTIRTFIKIKDLIINLILKLKRFFLLSMKKKKKGTIKTL